MARIKQALVLAAFCATSHSTPVQHAPSTNTTTSDQPLLQDFDALGAWFDGVAGISHSTIPRRPNVTIAIVGGGITGCVYCFSPLMLWTMR